MIAVDTNLLVYAHRAECEWHSEALRVLLGLAEGTQRWAIPWPCVHEFFSIATHARVFKKPSTAREAIRAIEAWFESPVLVLLHEGPSHWAMLSKLIERARITGPMIHDARIAAICLANGASVLWSADRDFSRFKDLKVVNPLVT